MIRSALIACLVACSLAALALHRTDGFSLQRCQISLLESQDPLESIAIAWPQRFHYLARGKQVFVFASVDGQYVLKLFDQRNLQDRWYAHLPGVVHLVEERKLRWAQWQAMYPESYRLAHAMLPNETGVLLVHLGRSLVAYPTIELIDKASRSHRVDLNQTPFVLQKRGTGTLLGRLQACSGDPFKLRALLEQYLVFHAKRIGLGIADRDRDIKNNYAWDGDTLLYIDPAQFVLKSESKEHAWRAATTPVRKWLVRNAPSAVPWFDEQKM